MSTQFRSIKYEHLLAQKKAPILERLARKKQSDAGTEFGKGLPKKEKIAFVHLDKSYPEIKSEKAEAETKPTTSPVSKPETKTQPKPIHVREEVAKIAGVSSGTVARFEQVQKKKPEMIDDLKHRRSVKRFWMQKSGLDS